MATSERIPEIEYLHETKFKLIREAQQCKQYSVLHCKDKSIISKRIYMSSNIFKLLNYCLSAVIFIILYFVLIWFLNHRMDVENTKEGKKAMNVASADLNVSKVLSCYYNLPDASNSSTAKQLYPAGIDAHMCSHINAAFAVVRNKQIFLNISQHAALTELVKLKTINKSLKILISVGGSGDDMGFPEMVADHSSRKIFIKSLKLFLKEFKLDGVDLDWEFPGVHIVQDTLQKRERQHFSQLLREIRAEYAREKKDYLLTVAVPAPEPIVHSSYDVGQLNLYVHYANVMCYDYHMFSKYTPFTGLNSPLYARKVEDLYLSTLNINYTVHMYSSLGLDKNKIVVGIPTYGHTFKLVNPDNYGIGSPASGFGELGSLGFVNYPDICAYIKKMKSSVQILTELDAKVPFLHSSTTWVSYDNIDSVTEKAKFVKANELRGAMVYSLNADDYLSICFNNNKFPLSQTIRNVLFSKNI